MSEFSVPWLGLSRVLNKLQFMTWWQSDSISKAWTHQNLSRQLRKRKGYEEQHIPCCLPPIGNQLVRAQDGSLPPGSLASYRGTEIAVTCRADPDMVKNQTHSRNQETKD